MRVGLDSRLGKAVVKMAGSKQFMRIGPKIVPHVDRFLPVHNLASLADLRRALQEPAADAAIRIFPH